MWFWQYSFHSNAHGFACDTVTNFEIVLANGTVVNANSTSNPDLFKAQKGGSGNLGFVTRIDQGESAGHSNLTFRDSKPLQKLSPPRICGEVSPSTALR